MRSTRKIVALTAIALAASLLVQNAVLVGVGAPGYGDPIEDVLAFQIGRAHV